MVVGGCINCKIGACSALTGHFNMRNLPLYDYFYTASLDSLENTVIDLLET